MDLKGTVGNELNAILACTLRTAALFARRCNLNLNLLTSQSRRCWGAMWRSE